MRCCFCKLQRIIRCVIKGVNFFFFFLLKTPAHLKFHPRFLALPGQVFF